MARIPQILLQVPPIGAAEHLLQGIPLNRREAAPFLLHEVPTHSCGDACGFENLKMQNQRAKRVGRRRAALSIFLEGQVVEVDARDNADGGIRLIPVRGTEQALTS